MKSIKPGRGPSMMSGIMCILVGIFGVIWTIIASSMGGGLFALFGVVFIIIAIVNAVYNFKNATSENRYSTFDIVDKGEEDDPFNKRFGKQDVDAWDMPQNCSESTNDSKFCPYCGAPVSDDYRFCRSCGKKQPE